MEFLARLTLIKQQFNIKHNCLCTALFQIYVIDLVVEMCFLPSLLKLIIHCIMLNCIIESYKYNAHHTLKLRKMYFV